MTTWNRPLILSSRRTGCLDTSIQLSVISKKPSVFLLITENCLLSTASSFDALAAQNPPDGSVQVFRFRTE